MFFLICDADVRQDGFAFARYISRWPWREILCVREDGKKRPLICYHDLISENVGS